jgi:Zn-dependent peptidase ImmA (M78 family)
MSSSCIFHRKRQALPVAKARRVHALLELYRIQLEALSDGVPLPDVCVPREAPTADGWVSPSDIARTTREVLGVGDGPVDNLVGLLEEAGVFVVRTDLGSRHIDAVTGWPKGRRPVVLLNVNAPTDRQRYTLAHELGHAVMHAESVDPVEAEADEFAAELLAPAAAIRPELDENLNLARLAELRVRWKLSMPALVRRAWDLGLLSSRQYKDLNIDLSRAGYRTREPAPLPAERPRLPGRLVTELRDRGLSDGAIAARALLDVDEFRHLYLGDPEEAA